LNQPEKRRWILLAGIGVVVLAGLLFITTFGGDSSDGDGVSIRPGGTETAAPTSTGGDSGGFSLGGGELASLAWRLALVLVVIGVSIAALRWWGRRAASPRSPSGFLRVVDTLAISNGRSIHLVALGERVIAVGATANQLTLLSELMDDESARVLEQSGRQEGQPLASFAADLFRVMKANATRAVSPRDEFVIGEERR
jgi:flagellar biogenesis protein FliO